MDILGTIGLFSICWLNKYGLLILNNYQRECAIFAHPRMISFICHNISTLFQLVFENIVLFFHTLYRLK